MTDEEKKAIEYLKRHIIPCYGRKGTIEFMLNDTLLNLIEKQSKEIEEYKKQLDLDYVKNNYTSNDKIKAKIEVLEKLQKEFPNNDEIRIKIIAYKELLEKG